MSLGLTRNIGWPSKVNFLSWAGIVTPTPTCRLNKWMFTESRLITAQHLIKFSALLACRCPLKFYHTCRELLSHSWSSSVTKKKSWVSKIASLTHKWANIAAIINSVGEIWRRARKAMRATPASMLNPALDVCRWHTQHDLQPKISMENV